MKTVPFEKSDQFAEFHRLRAILAVGAEFALIILQDQSVLLQWIGAWCDESQRAVPPDHQPGKGYEFKRTGQAQELLALAYDIYCLLQGDRLDRDVRDRLKTYDKFQGSRYELAVAAIFVRSGFDIE